MVNCSLCEKESNLVSAILGICVDCIIKHFEQVRPKLEKIHSLSRQRFDLPEVLPRDPGGIRCNYCVNLCQIAQGHKGYCGLRYNDGETKLKPLPTHGYLSWYFDSLPTNCVANWVCPGGSECGYPEFSHSRGPEYGYKNLAVFCWGCSFNCLFCQNWHFKEELKKKQNRSMSVSTLAKAVDSQTSCICFFGGDPTPQLPYILNVCKLARKEKEKKILRICWETNGSMKTQLLKKMLEISLESGGCLKFDLKSWNEQLHIALCGVSNRRTLENFAFAAGQSKSRKNPPLVIASTLLVPGYINEEEVYNLAKFIAAFDPDIPYSLLGFYPHFFMNDLPLTSRLQAENCFQAALDAGLKRVKIGNIHLLEVD